MKNLIAIAFLAILIVACASEEKKEKEVSVNLDQYPPKLVKVLEAHGGLETWNKQKLLKFSKGEEIHTIDLSNRKSLVVSPKYTLGYNGKNTWLKEKDSAAFKGNPDFYHNLFFYFYAMPFVLADDGIVYDATDSLIVEGKSYPGIKISFKDGVGASSKDNYYLYYNPKNHQMEWLGYTVTFFDNKAKDETSIIKYDEWQDIDGLKLPRSLVWYEKDSIGNIVPPKTVNPVTFEEVSLSTKEVDSTFFEEVE
ncbi:hypothetical protein HX109_01610 [Galbibacter sp. BG1]|uniref:DUF6503 family protein n=1 Tax=Galbibacter sp. BG1 TaxID=1170699 RepID=UPI0015C0F231|nr:DUF6503 family protein [Galbibacter sp. BG1]QLE00318.1 hypothetical protein HX109_01610 [Galbibacter sp. BG1]